jgi:hypothetical protein
MAILKAIQLIDVQWGNGRFDKAELMHTLREGLPKPAPDRTIKRPAAQATELLGLDDNGGH